MRKETNLTEGGERGGEQLTTNIQVNDLRDDVRLLVGG